MTLSLRLRPTTGLPSTEMGMRAPEEQSLPWTLPVFGGVPRTYSSGSEWLLWVGEGGPWDSGPLQPL